MARKPSDIVQPNLRIREDLRRQLEQAATKRGVSLNQEMNWRLRDSFDREALFTLGRVASDMEIHWARFGRTFHELGKLGDLVRTSQAVLKLIGPLLSDEGGRADRGALSAAAAELQKTLKMIDAEAALAIRHATTSTKGGHQ
jgi:hypothetical protein